MDGVVASCSSRPWSICSSGVGVLISGAATGVGAASRSRTRSAWVELSASMVEGSLILDPSCNSWYNGANVAGKKRMFLAYPGGIPDYRRRCDEIASDGYRGFELR